MSSKLSQNNARDPAFARNDRLEVLLRDLNGDMWTAEQKLLEHYDKPRLPLIFVMGPHRSGTTLFMQWLANTGLVAYPTNLLSRFYCAPILGAKIQLLLTDSRYSFRRELADLAGHVEYKSENGKTDGVLAPNEFWYFWRRFLADSSRDIWTDEELRKTMNTQTMLAELAGIVDVFKRPFAAKGMLFNYNIPFLSSIFEKVLFVQIRRDPIENVASILEARRRQHGHASSWYSFKIPEYPALKEMGPVMQSAGQQYFISKAVDSGMAFLSENQRMVVDYEAFCASPRSVFNVLCEKLDLDATQYHGPALFHKTQHCMDGLNDQIRSAVEYFNGF